MALPGGDAPLKVDLHPHILPRDWPDLEKRYGYGGFVQIRHLGPDTAELILNGGCFRQVDGRCYDVERRLADCDRLGVQVQALSTVPVMFSYWARGEDAHDLARLLNDDLAATVAAHPRRFVGLGTLPMQAPDLAVKELERCRKELGLAGVQIGTHVGDWNLDAPEVFAVLAAARDLDAAVFVHPWDMLGADRMQRYMLRWLVGMPAETALALCSVIFGGVLERLPGLRLAFAHGGGAFPGTFGRIRKGFEARPDLCAAANEVDPAAYLDRIYLDSLVHDPAMLRHLLALVGEERVVLGSDYPFPLGEERPGEIIESLEGLGPATRRRLLADNALAFLGLSRDPFAP